MTTKSEGKWCYNVIPARWVFVFLGFFGFCLVYSYKVVLSVAIVSMAGHPPKNSTNETVHECNVNNTSDDAYKQGDFDWDDNQQAIILGAFFYGYVLTQLPAGVMAQRIGGKWIFGGAILITAIFALLGPLAAKTHYILFIVTRVIQGLAEGVVFPCMNAMLARWMPKMERSRGTTIIFTGSQIGTVLTLPLAGYLCDGTFLGGWPAVFYVLGFVGCIWFALWAFFVHESPDSHPHISQREYDYITSDQGEEKTSEKPVIPWKKIFTSGPVYALIFTHFCQNWGFLTVLTLMPTYFTKVLHLDLKKNSLMSSLPYLLQAIVGWVASIISDKIRQKGIVSVTVIRKVNNSIAYFGPAICMVGVALSGCDSNWSIAFFILAMGLNGCCYPGFNSTHVDMAPEFAGTLMGLTNGIGNLPGFIAPVVAAAFYSKGHTLKNWSWVFYISAGTYVVGAIVYNVFATAQLQPWGISKKSKPSHDNSNKNNVYPVTNLNKFDDHNGHKLY